MCLPVAGQPWHAVAPGHGTARTYCLAVRFLTFGHRRRGSSHHPPLPAPSRAVAGSPGGTARRRRCTLAVGGHRMAVIAQAARLTLQLIEVGGQPGDGLGCTLAASAAPWRPGRQAAAEAEGLQRETACPAMQARLVPHMASRRDSGKAPPKPGARGATLRPHTRRPHTREHHAPLPS